MDNRPYGPQDGFRGGFAEHVGGHGGVQPLWWVIFALLLALLLLALVSLTLDLYYRSQGRPPLMKWLPPGGPGGPGRALAVLDVRYARGELSRRDYLRARGDILGPDLAAEETTEVVPPEPEKPARRGRKPRTA